MTDRRTDFPDYVAARRGELRRLAFVLCGDWHHADDVVQIALTKLYRAWPRVRHAGAEDAYVRRIIATTVIDESRRPWRRETPIDRVHQQTAVRSGSIPDAFDALHGQRDDVDILELLALLPAQQRTVVVLRHWLELSVQDAARTLGISEGTVKSQTSKGLAKLRVLLRPDWEGTRP